MANSDLVVKSKSKDEPTAQKSPHLRALSIGLLARLTPKLLFSHFYVACCFMVQILIVVQMHGYFN